MTRVSLDNITMKRESKSYTDSVYAILTAAELFHGPKYMLSGLMGMAFKFSVHEQLLPLSVSAYGQWGNEHKPAVDNLGVYTEIDGGRTRHPTFRSYQETSLKSMKQSIDQGKGVVYWIPEFGVIHGYDDEEGVFFVLDGYSEESQVVLYDNFGLNFTPFWYVQTFGDKIGIDPKEMFLESIRLAIEDWDAPYRTLPNKDIASGRLAYTYLIHGLERGKYDEYGASYILDSYHFSRIEILEYLREACESMGELKAACVLYDQLASGISGMKEILTDQTGTRRVDRERIRELIMMLTEAAVLEEEAVNSFRVVSMRYPDRKRESIPRWGAHSPR